MTIAPQQPAFDAAAPSRPRHARRSIGWFGLLVLLLVALTVVRLIGLRLSAVDLFYDEAQYWSWSRELAFGYFSKPPLLAWVITGAERICGSAEWCVRSPSPVFYLATSLTLFALGKTLYDERTGFWAAVLAAFTPAMAFSSRIISTDVPLLFFWALALLAYAHLLIRPDKRWGVVAGIALGLGLLAKYAMIYFIPGMLLAALVSKRARRLLGEAPIWIALPIAAVVISPNVVWNATHKMVTFEQTGGLVLGEPVRLSVLRMLEFLAAQFAVFGPLVFAVLIVATVGLGSTRLREQDRVMVAFALPAVAIVSVFALSVHAYANWAAVSFISAVALTAALLLRWSGNTARVLLWTSLALGAITQPALLVGDMLAPRLSLPFRNGENPYARTLGWREFGETAGDVARRAGAATIASDSRPMIAAVLYYWRDREQDIRSWPSTGSPTFDLTRPLQQTSAEPVLFISLCPEPQRLQFSYASVEPLGLVRTAVGTSGQRGFYAFKLSGARGANVPLAACGPR